MRHLFGVFGATFGYQYEDAARLLLQPSFLVAQRLQQPPQDSTQDCTRVFHTKRNCSPTPSKSPDVLHLPADFFFLLSDHLDTPSAHALSLTCRAFYNLGLPKTRHKLEDQDKRALLTLLERDSVGDDYYYCQRCNKLHTYRDTYGPHSVEERIDKSQAFVCGMRDRFTPMGNAYDLGYHHVRLVMNRHFHGHGGIPIQAICLQHEARREAITIRCSTAANIIDNELYLRRSYDFVLSNADVPAFRRCTGHRDFRLCEHTPFFRNSSVYHQDLPELQRRPRAPSNKDEFVPCTSSPGSCGLCLLDYDVSIVRIDNGAAWKVMIEAYHLLGACRSPDDWKWARFTEKTRPHLFLPNRPNRRGSGYGPGVVKKAWVQAGVAGIVDGTDVRLKHHSV